MDRSVKELYNLNRRVSVITGGAGLLGEMHAEAIAEFEGIAVLVDVNKSRLEERVLELSKRFGERVFGEVADITNEANVNDLRDRILKKFGRIDILINNAANNPSMAPSEGSKNFSRLENFMLQDWNADINVGLTGSFLCCKIFGTVMAQAQRGVVINVASDLGLIGPDQRIYRKDGLSDGEQPVKPITYSVVKGALISMTRYLATYWAAQGIRVNCISPGGVYTNQPDEFVQKLTNLIPMGRMAKRDEYKGAICFLASDASSYMTGANLVVDGGRTAW